VVAIRCQSGRWTVPRGLSMRTWLRGGGPRPVVLEDLKAHLKTVIPPVRASGYLELRMIDAQPGDQWVVPVAVVASLLDDPWASDRAAATLAGVRPLSHRTEWLRAAQRGLAEPDLASAATSCLLITLESLRRRNAPPWVYDAVARFTYRFAAQGRCPADDVVAQPADASDRSRRRVA
jgi:glutamate--cysteine ligase